ncbi:hypothetical protein Bca4012_044808 [Brassica carinata]|uniref:BnaC09g31930D protein n=3 Tax=Brassica TaxID=3705 RepID=A0A078G4N5_BRANA|nr:BnaC09g31930D [Brassica napus]VDD32150.1 unnamed protein product [Brassica oleracea]
MSLWPPLPNVQNYCKTKTFSLFFSSLSSMSSMSLLSTVSTSFPLSMVDIAYAFTIVDATPVSSMSPHLHLHLHRHLCLCFHRSSN